jgi:hypothetical protein
MSLSLGLALGGGHAIIENRARALPITPISAVGAPQPKLAAKVGPV